MPSVDYKKLYEESQLDIKRLSGYAEMVCKAHAETKEDLIDFAKMKQERVFELEKELEEVKKERDIFKGLHKITRCKKVGFMNMKASEDFDKLKENSLPKDKIIEILDCDDDLEDQEILDMISDGEKSRTIEYCKEIDLNEDFDKLKEENKELKETIECHNAQFNYLGDSGNIEDYRDFNKFLKYEYSEEEYQKIYDNLCLYDYLESESEDEE